jgi:hypothetical protein
MRRSARCGGFLAVLLWTAAGPAAARTTVTDSSRIALTVGPSFEAHSDLLASPFRQSGVGVGFGLGYRRGSLSVDVTGAVAGTSSRLDAPDEGVEDTWTAGLDVAWVHPVAAWERTAIRVGGSLAGLAFIRRHHYGHAAAREYYADLMVPVSLVGEAVRRVADDASVEERLELGVGAVLFRSPFAATKTFPAAALAGPGTLALARNRITVEWRASARTRLAFSHALTFYDTDLNRLARVVQQRVGVGVVLVPGGAR